MTDPTKPRKADREPTEPNRAFIWPPKAEQDASKLTVHLSKAKPTHHNRTIESIETHLLGRTGLSFDRWALKTGWTRDHQNDYCWRCGSSIGAHESDGEGCASCRKKPLQWDRAIRLGKYADVLRDEVLLLKFGCWRPTGTGLGTHLGLAILEQLDNAQIPTSEAILVPIPMHRFRRISRGVDHTLVIARGASKSSGCRIERLLKAQYRPEQVGLSKTARAQNVKGAFNLTKFGERQIKMSGVQKRQILILIDDVRTTGATFVAGSKALKQALNDLNTHTQVIYGPVEIWVASIGVAGESRRENLDSQG